jgi:hypothetical protein
MNFPTDLASILNEHGSSFFSQEIYNIDMKGWAYADVDQYGGEGQGDDYWLVYSFEKDGQKLLVKFQGWYDSYNGAEYSEYKVVTAQEKTITVYE